MGAIFMQWDQSTRPRVLVLAFACEPHGGSEPGAGWAVARSVAEIADVVILTRPHHHETIQKWLAEHPGTPIQSVAAPFACQDSRLIKMLAGLDQRVWFIPYCLWLISAKRTMLQLEAEQPFDAAVHAAYSCYWLPSPLWRMKAPVVWGPVGGGTRTPRALWPCLGWRGLIGEWQKLIALKLACLLPATRRTWKRVAIRVTETQNSRLALPASLQPDTRVINRCLLTGLCTPPTSPKPRQSYLIFPSLLDSRKAPRLALSALALTPPSVKLIFLSGGREEQVLKEMARKLNIADRVEFRGRVPREQLFDMMAQTAGVLFTGVREEGGMALAEAMSVGAPAIVLGIGGALQIAEHNTDPDRICIIKPASLATTARRLADAMTQFSNNPTQAVGNYLDSAPATVALHKAVRDAIAIGESQADRQAKFLKQVA